MGEIVKRPGTPVDGTPFEAYYVSIGNKKLKLSTPEGEILTAQELDEYFSQNPTSNTILGSGDYEEGIKVLPGETEPIQQTLIMATSDIWEFEETGGSGGLKVAKYNKKTHALVSTPIILTDYLSLAYLKPALCLVFMLLLYHKTTKNPIFFIEFDRIFLLIKWATSYSILYGLSP